MCMSQTVLIAALTLLYIVVATPTWPFEMQSSISPCHLWIQLLSLLLFPQFMAVVPTVRPEL